jgi:RHS repeat-associated protein
LVDGNERIAARYTYDPFGNVLAMDGPLAEANLYRFSSKEAHPNSGLVYYGYRFYDPNLQRWINRDPIQEEGGINLYGFLLNDPLNFVDPKGSDRYEIDGPYLVIYPSWYKFWRDDVEVLCGTRELYERAIGKANLENAIEAAVVAAAVATAVAGMGEGHGDLKTCKDSQLKEDGIDAHDLKGDYVGKENVPKYNIAKDSDGNVYLVPVKKGEGDPVPVPVKYPDLSDTYPIKKK